MAEPELIMAHFDSVVRETIMGEGAKVELKTETEFEEVIARDGAVW